MKTSNRQLVNLRKIYSRLEENTAFLEPPEIIVQILREWLLLKIDLVINSLSCFVYSNDSLRT